MKITTTEKAKTTTAKTKVVSKTDYPQITHEVFKDKYPLLVITESADERFPTKLGLRKLKLILDHLDEVKAFITKFDKAGK